MQFLGMWTTRVKWTLLILLLIWGTYLASIAYVACRADATDKLSCGIGALIGAYIAILLQVISVILWLLNLLLP